MTLLLDDERLNDSSDCYNYLNDASSQQIINICDKGLKHNTGSKALLLLLKISNHLSPVV